MCVCAHVCQRERKIERKRENGDRKREREIEEGKTTEKEREKRVVDKEGEGRNHTGRMVEIILL